MKVTFKICLWINNTKHMKHIKHWAYVILALLIFCFSFSLKAQRKTELLDRGIIAMPKSSSEIYISWRHFTEDPDEIMYNIYYKKTEYGQSTKLNKIPISKSTNYLSNVNIGSNKYYFSIKRARNGIEKDEQREFIREKSRPVSRIVREIFSQTK